MFPVQPWYLPWREQNFLVLVLLWLLTSGKILFVWFVCFWQRLFSREHVQWNKFLLLAWSHDSKYIRRSFGAKKWCEIYVAFNSWFLLVDFIITLVKKNVMFDVYSFILNTKCSFIQPNNCRVESKKKIN